MKYSLTLDVCLTVIVWAMFGYTLMGLFIALVVGMVASIKVATLWHRTGGIRGVCMAAVRRVRGVRHG